MFSVCDLVNVTVIIKKKGYLFPFENKSKKMGPLCRVICLARNYLMVCVNEKNKIKTAYILFDVLKKILLAILHISIY